VLLCTAHSRHLDHGHQGSTGKIDKKQKDKLDSKDEWIILKVPKKMKGKFFFADFCDGDSEDEFQWLEGPYLMENFTVADLLGIKRALPRSARRRRGLTEFRDDPVLDSCLHKKKEVNHKESGQSHLKMEHPVSRVLESNPNGESPVSSRSRPINS
jgi:hypothetical protein